MPPDCTILHPWSWRKQNSLRRRVKTHCVFTLLLFHILKLWQVCHCILFAVTLVFGTSRCISSSSSLHIPISAWKWSNVIVALQNRFLICKRTRHSYIWRERRKTILYKLVYLASAPSRSRFRIASRKREGSRVIWAWVKQNNNVHELKQRGKRSFFNYFLK